MPQTLYQSGIDPSNPSSKTLIPRAISTSEEINILWSSWCDLIYTTTNTEGTRSIVYIGTGLSPAQQEDFTSPGSTINQALADPTCRPKFFGSTIHEGVRGYVCKWRLRIFSTPSEQDIGSWDLLASPVGDISMCSDSSVLVSLPSPKITPREASTGGNIVVMPHLHLLGSRSVTGEVNEHVHVADFMPTQLAVNATTSTALSPSGQVYTRTIDPRYPSTLGRPYTGASIFESVPYLSETCITKIASGGYMTAAISKEGELFLWGQSNPGTRGGLGVFRGLDYDTDATIDRETTVRGDALQDDDVKCLNIQIGGFEVEAYDLAVGFGHILVAAKNIIGEHVVFAAGCGTEGQLGIGEAVALTEEFEEVPAFRGKRVIQLAAAGWSSFIVTKD